MLQLPQSEVQAITTQGCWTLHLSWGGHTDQLSLRCGGDFLPGVFSNAGGFAGGLVFEIDGGGIKTDPRRAESGEIFADYSLVACDGANRI